MLTQKNFYGNCFKNAVAAVQSRHSARKSLKALFSVVVPLELDVLGTDFLLMCSVPKYGNWCAEFWKPLNSWASHWHQRSRGRLKGNPGCLTRGSDQDIPEKNLNISWYITISHDISLWGDSHRFCIHDARWEHVHMTACGHDDEIHGAGNESRCDVIYFDARALQLNHTLMDQNQNMYIYYNHCIMRGGVSVVGCFGKKQDLMPESHVKRPTKFCKLQVVPIRWVRFQPEDLKRITFIRTPCNGELLQLMCSIVMTFIHVRDRL